MLDLPAIDARNVICLVQARTSGHSSLSVTHLFKVNRSLQQVLESDLSYDLILFHSEDLLK